MILIVLDFYNNINKKSNGWISTFFLILFEIFVIFFFSNFPFFIAALQIDSTPGIDITLSLYSSFLNVLQDEVRKGQLLSFVCALIAPIIYWSFVERKKAFWTKLLLGLSMMALALSLYLHDRDVAFKFFTSFELYIATIMIWIMSVLCNRIPPKRKNYKDLEDEQTKMFVEKTRKFII